MAYEAEIIHFQDPEGNVVSIRRNYEQAGPRRMPGDASGSCDPCILLYVGDELRHSQPLDFAYLPVVVEQVIRSRAAEWSQGASVRQIQSEMECLDSLLFDKDNTTGHIGPW
ncbi:MAG: hypothetical protein KKD17_05085 [Nanoarchaeota archaeon]|nr:hypothetical protein [Nanoarchaeota archaeon]